MFNMNLFYLLCRQGILLGCFSFCIRDLLAKTKNCQVGDFSFYINLSHPKKTLLAFTKLISFEVGSKPIVNL